MNSLKKYWFKIAIEDRIVITWVLCVAMIFSMSYVAFVNESVDMIIISGMFLAVVTIYLHHYLIEGEE